jgi:protein O-mannosyl-transferase
MKERWHAYIVAVGTAAATFAVYLATLRNGFVTWDDGQYIVNNTRIRSLDWPFLRWAFSDYLTSGNWHPVTWISHALDYAFWGLNPAGHHLTTVILHTANTFLVAVLVVELLGRAGNASGPAGPPEQGDRLRLIVAGVTGLLFGLHPLHVESVAWASERKDVLCAFFFLLSIAAYLSFTKDMPGNGAVPSRRLFPVDRKLLLSLGFFTLALLSKAMAVTLPVVLLLLDRYPLRRYGSFREAGPAIREKTPFFVLSVTAAALAFATQKASGAMTPLAHVAFPDRLLVAGKALMVYLGKMVLPVHLLPLYPYPRTISITMPEFFVPILLAVGITAGTLYLAAARQRPVWLCLWGYYCITVLPVLGIVQIGEQAMADRYTYLPSIGPFLLAGLAGGWLWERTGALRNGRAAARGLLATAAAALAVALSSGTLQQIGRWKSGLELWSYAIAAEAGSVPGAFVNRGVAFEEEKQYDRAVQDYTEAIAIDPSQDKAYHNRGWAYRELGQIDKALKDYDTAIRLNPRYASAYNNRGLVYRDIARFDRAIEDFTAALERDPRYDKALNNRGMVFAQLGQYDRAIGDFSEAIRMNGANARAYVNRGLAWIETQQYGRAREDLDVAIGLDPALPDAFNNRGLVLGQLGELDRALEDFTRAIALDPSAFGAYVNRGIALGRMGRTDEAVLDLTAAIGMRPDAAAVYVARGTLLRQAGSEDLAVQDFRTACGLGSREGCDALRRRTGRPAS